MIATMPATTSAELAKATRLHEHYVREWRSTMYTGKIVVLDDSTRLTAAAAPGGKHGINGVGQTFSSDVRFVLPPESPAFLTWGRGPENVSLLSQDFSILSAIETLAVDCFVLVKVSRQVKRSKCLRACKRQG